MRILCLGSLNRDLVFNVDHIARDGESVHASSYEVFLGGKGLNQSIALARAGADVFHAGAVGVDGAALVEQLRADNVDTRYVQTLEEPSGQAMIQVDSNGQNAIVIHMGANGRITKSFIDEVFSAFHRGDIVLLQNEITNVKYAIERGKENGLVIAFNPSPITKDLFSFPLHLVDILIANEIEGSALVGVEEIDDYEKILKRLHEKYPHMLIVLTVGRNGALCCADGKFYRHGACDVPVVDSTGAGDTFSGYFVACIAKGLTPAQALECASRASSIAVTRKGAANSIPTMDEVEHFVG